MHSRTIAQRGDRRRLSQRRAAPLALFGAALLSWAAMPICADAQGLVQGVEQGSRAGNKAAGPVGGVLGGAIGGVAGVVGGVLGVPAEAPPPQQPAAPPPDVPAPAAAAAKGAGTPAKRAKAAAAKTTTKTTAKTANSPNTASPAAATVPAAVPVALTAEQIVASSDANIARIKAELHLSPEQDKHWTAFSAAMHALGNNGADRLRLRAERAKRDPPDDIVEQMRNEAQFLSDRAQDQRNVADAADPLFMSLDAQQKPVFIEEMVRLSRERGLD
ncbi:MAG TPA: Spy/CpxP family protein refolding chaperone [Rhodopseudomonas sp.]|uniref:Spy/CpxP family protein refolding chaperone n=1 Tax=Rhodopseudomonas sp. TaxID=1078 RepID=UPI002EDA8690